MRLVLTLFFCLYTAGGFAAPVPTTATTKLLEIAPIRFEPNAGLHQKGIRWISRGQGYTFAFTDRATLLRVGNRTVRLTFPGANGHAKFEGEKQQIASTNYFYEQKRVSVPAFARLREPNVYRGIDVVYYGTGREIEYDFEVAPGADPSRIRMHFDGVDAMRLNEHGDLILTLGSSEITQRVPVVYQRGASGEIVKVDASYRIGTDGAVRVQVASYNRAEKLIVDPTITYSAYLQGSGFDQGTVVTHDSKGLVYMAGSTNSQDFPIVGDSEQPASGGGTNVWLMQLDPTQGGNAILYSTYLGGGATDILNSMVIDQNGVFYVTGSTSSGGFPVSAGALVATNAANTHGFVSMIDSTQGSNGLIYSSYLGGTQNDSGNGIAVANGFIYVTGTTDSPDFPVAGNSYQVALSGDFDAFVVQIDPTQSGAASEVAGTYLGGVFEDVGETIALDAAGQVYVAGLTFSDGFPVSTNGYQQSYTGGGDGFLSVLNLQAGTLVYSTFLGGSAQDEVKKLVIDPKGQVAMTGYTLSFDFPVTKNALQAGFGGVSNAFLAILNLQTSQLGVGLTYSTFYGGTGGEVAYDLKLDLAGNYYLCGYTLSTDLPVTANAMYPASDGAGLDGFIAVINPAAPSASGKGLVYGTYMTAQGFSSVYGIDVDASSNIYVIGLTTSNIFPNAVPPNSIQGKSSAFLMIFTLP
jgi:Beta-propeller repeat